MDAISADGTVRPSGGCPPPAETGVLATLAALLDHLGIRYHWRGGKLLLPAVWHGKTKLTVAVWPGGGWNNAARFGEHGTWRELLDRLGIEDPDDRAALARAAATGPDRHRELGLAVPDGGQEHLTAAPLIADAQ
ncbi:MAG TPA: hypothetical protein VES89_01040 [Candidatus Competibacteraceae bacterium]|nr:hypothetical protein [Candidatus Competibacteraceae bacterium]